MLSSSPAHHLPGRYSRPPNGDKQVGVMSDCTVYTFAFLDKNRKLFLSPTFRWMIQKVEIVQWIDQILRDAIEASPHTTPVKNGNTTVKAYQTHLNRGYQFGSSTVPEILVDEDGRRFKVLQQSRLDQYVMELESDEEREPKT